MGWQDDTGKHEGWVMGLELLTREAARWREIHPYVDTPRYRALSDTERRAWNGIRVEWIQVVCECGWRSSRMVAPLGTYWAPNTIELPNEDHEDAARKLWRDHVDHVRATDYDSLAALAKKEAQSHGR